jgi:hypothetical protein
MLSPLEILYALASAKSSRDKEKQAAAITTYGMLGEKLVAVGPGEDAPEGFKALAGVTGSGASINIPQPKTPDPITQNVDYFAKDVDSVPGSGNFTSSGGGNSYGAWQQIFMREGLEGEGLATAMGNLHMIGTATYKNGIRQSVTLNKDLYEQEDNSVKTAVAQGASTLGYQFNENFYADSTEDLEKLQQNVNAVREEDPDAIINIVPGSRQSFFQEGTGSKVDTNFFRFTPNDKSLPEALQVAMGLKAAEQNVTSLTWKEKDNTPKTLNLDRKNMNLFDQSFLMFISGKNAADPKIWSRLNKEELARFHAVGEGYIRRQLQTTDGQGGTYTDPDVLANVAPTAYPEVFAIKGFTQYFMSKVRGVDRDQIIAAGESINSTPEGNISFVANTGIDGVKMVIPSSLDPYPQYVAPYSGLRAWIADTVYGHIDDPQKRITDAGTIAANSLITEPDPNGYGLLVKPNQPTMLALSRMTSTLTLSGNRDVLTNAHHYYDPKRPAFTADMQDLGTVAIEMNNAAVYVPAGKKYNAKFDFVSVFAPSIATSGQNVGDVSTFYRLNKFKQDTFEGKSFDDMQATQRAIGRTGLEAAMLLQQAQSLMFIVRREGNEIIVEKTPLGQNVAETFVEVQGVLTNIREGLKMAAEGLGIIPEEGLVATMTQSLDQAIDVTSSVENRSPDSLTKFTGYFRSFRSVTAMGQDSADVEQAAAAKGQTVQQFYEAESAARKQNSEALAQIFDEMNSGDTLKVNTAKRKYLNYMIAYTVAAAMQGGTGGRTISDQDVQNVLRALSLTAGGTPASEYAVYEDMKNYLLYKAQRGQALGSKDNQTVFNAMIVADLETRQDFDITRDLRERVEGLRGPESSGGRKPTDTNVFTVGKVSIPKTEEDSFLVYVNKVKGQYEDTRDLPDFTSMEEFLQAASGSTSARVASLYEAGQRRRGNRE